MSSTISMDASGRLVLPKALRERLNLKGGALLAATVVGDRIELAPVADAGALALKRSGGMLVIARSGAAVDAAGAVAHEREAQAERGRGR